MPITKTCKLCFQNRELRLSHVVPAFVFRWLKQSSPTGHMRDVQSPNRRVQDGWKDYLLCGDCEQLLSSFETPFADQVFYPLHRNEATQFKYLEWALKFAVSVVWRAAVFGGEEANSHLSDEQLKQFGQVEVVWREFLLGQRPDPGYNQVHLIPLDVVSEHTVPGLSPFINRYLTRSVDVDVIANSSDILVYAKLCRVLLLGHVSVDNHNAWRASRVALKKGVIGGPISYWLPGSMYEYMNERAAKNAEAIASLSNRQKEKIREVMEADLDKVASSEVFRAMRADVNLAGKEAFRATELTCDEARKD